MAAAFIDKRTMAPRYRFVTVWRLRCPQAAAWDAIVDSRAWPVWWPGVESVLPLKAGDSSGAGSVSRFVWKSRLPYTLAFDMTVTRVEAPRLLAGDASGELAGTGVWELDQAEDVTTVRYTWDVSTTRAWMNLLAPIARPLFAWNHDHVMKNGGRALARRLSCELLTNASEAA
jgi:hypothetical protein